MARKQEQLYTWEQMARSLADEGHVEAAKALATKHGPPPPIYTERGVLRTKKMLAGEQNEAGEVSECKPLDLTDPDVARVLAEHALSDRRTMNHILAYCDSALEALTQNGPLGIPLKVSGPSGPKPRRKITDPEILAKRNQALEKARAARAERLAAQRALAAAVEEPVPVG